MAWKAQATTILDVRPELAQGGEPFARIMEVAEGVQPGESFVLIAPFNPVPLYSVLNGRGFTSATEHVSDDEWIVSFTRER